MKNKGLLITLTILLSLIVVLLTVILALALMGRFSLSNMTLIKSYKGSSIALEKTFDADGITTINVKNDAGDITFKESEDDKIKVTIYGESEAYAEADLKDEELSISYRSTKKFALFSLGNVKNDIVVYVPADYDGLIDIKSDYGNSSVLDLENASLNLDLDAGNAEVGIIKNVEIKCDYGNVVIKEVLNKCNIKADCGNINIKKVSIKEDSTIKADLGNVEIDTINDVYVDADVDLGKADIEGNNRNSDVTLKISCDLGNVIVGK